GAALEGCALCLERGPVKGWRQRVQRHVADRRGAPGRRARGAGGESFPLRPSRFVEMDVRIDDTGKHRQAGGVELLAGARNVADGADPSGLDEEIDLADAVIDHDGRAAHGEIAAQSASSMRKRCAPSCSTRRPSSRNSSRPSTIVAKWFPASCPILLAKSVAP